MEGRRYEDQTGDLPHILVCIAEGNCPTQGMANKDRIGYLSIGDEPSQAAGIVVNCVVQRWLV